MTATSPHQKRLAAFQLSADEIALVRTQADFVRGRLPALLQELHNEFSGWPEIQRALMSPEVHTLRLAHWIRAASGHLEDGFEESAGRLAAAFVQQGVPSYAVAICHAVVARAISRELGVDRPLGHGLKGRLAHGQARERLALGVALNKIAWLDLELLLETYAEVEAAQRRRTQEELEVFQRKVQSVVTVVNSSSLEMEQMSSTVASSVEQTKNQAVAVSSASNEASANVQSVASAAEELACSIREVSEQVSKAATVARTANDAARKTDATVQELANSAQKVGDIVALINNVAAQTNLLALNATIEAARAGEAGKGFAVVASEVKNLAGQTAKATDDIGAQIQAMQEATQDGVVAIERIVKVINDLDQITAMLASAVEQQRASTQEIAANVHRAAVGTEEVARNITGVSGAAQVAGDAAGQVLTVAKSLSREAAVLSEAVEGLIMQSRAA